MLPLKQAGLATILTLLTQGCVANSNAETKFIVLGDIPYGADQAQTLESHIGPAIRDGGYPFVVHYGDIRAGYESCDGLFPPNRDYKPTTEHQRDLIYGLLPGAVFYSPGDNDWTDCDRKGRGDALKSLKEVRSVFFTSANNLPNVSTWKVKRQDRYPENARWEYNDLLFATLHIVGSDNGRYEIIPEDDANVKATLDEVDARDEANRKWLDEAFSHAKTGSIKALVLFMQADPGEIEPYRWKDDEGIPLTKEEFERKRQLPCSETVRVVCNAFLKFLHHLTDGANDLNKPVLLVHGSTNKFCLDKGFGGWQAKKLWRLNGPGDFVTIDAAVVRFDAEAAAPFTVTGLFSEIAPPDCQGR